MNTKEIDTLFEDTLDDGRLSRTERQALTERLQTLAPGPEQLAQVRSRAFAVARAHIDDPESLRLLGWLEELIKLTVRADLSTGAQLAEARFSPGPGCLDMILDLFQRARRSVDVCVFTITDDRIAEAVLRAHERGVRLRVISDDDKSLDLGSDLRKLAREGIEVVVDQSPHHMHHKFAVFDDALLLTGSYNWTRSAASDNQENLIVTDDPRLVRSFIDAFENLWRELGRYQS